LRICRALLRPHNVRVCAEVVLVQLIEIDVSDTELFCAYKGLFCAYIGLFCVCTGLCCVYVGLLHDGIMGVCVSEDSAGPADIG